MTGRMKRHLLQSIAFLAGGIFVLLLPSLVAHFPEAAENYARNIFPILSFPLVFLTSLLPFSLTEVFLYLLITAAPVLLVLFFVRLFRGKKRFAFCLSVACALMAVFLVCALLYTFMHGMNYSRYPMSELLFPEKRERSLEDLAEVTGWLARMSSETRDSQRENEHGVMILSSSLAEALSDGNEALDLAAADFPVLSGNHADGKGVWISPYWSYTGITGMYMPFLGEANVNTDVPALNLPLTICHELAHVRGAAREQDANLVGFLGCIYSPRVDFRYSGYQFAYRYCASDLYRADPEVFAEVSRGISEAVGRDWADNSAYWKQFEGPVQEVSTKINDSFLQANRQEGVVSYSRVTELIVEYYFQYIKN